MDFTKMRALNSLFAMLNQAARNILNYNSQHPDFPMTVGALNLCLSRQQGVQSEVFLVENFQTESQIHLCC